MNHKNSKLKYLSWLLCTFFLMVYSSFAQTPSIAIPVSFQRTKSFPVDSTTVFTNYEEAVEYASKGADKTSAAYKGQYIAVPTNGVYFINDNWELQEIGTGFKAYAGNSFAEDDYESVKASDIYFKMDYNTNHDYTTVVMITNNVTGEVLPTILIPQVGQRGSDGLNLAFGGPWDGGKSYSNETVVTWNGAAYVSKQEVPYSDPQIDITDTDYWEIFVNRGIDGTPGPAATIEVGDVLTTNYLSPAVVTNVGNESAAIFNFIIPTGEPGIQGDPGIGLVYEGEWTTNTVYPSNSVVRFDSKLWWTPDKIEEGADPTIDTAHWHVYLQDGSDGKSPTITVQREVIPVAAGGNAEVIANPTETGVDIQFKIPDGAPGSPGKTMQPHIAVDMQEPGTTPSVQESIVGTNVTFTLGIPKGDQGPPGAELAFYGDWVTNTAYAAKSLVVYSTNTWYTLTGVESGTGPPDDNSSWHVFVPGGQQGVQGDTIIPFAYATNSPYGSPATVTNNLDGMTNFFYFGIPEGKQGERGPPGFDLVYEGSYVENTEYQEKSLVRHGTNLWYTSTSTTNIPGTDDSPWEIVLSDGKAAKVSVNPVVESLDSSLPPYVHSDPVEGGNEVTLSFGIPKGEKGNTGNAATILIDDVETGLPGTQASVTNIGTTTDAKFKFVIPRGSPGANLHYEGSYKAASAPYSANSLVRHGTNLWYTDVATSDEPGETQTWKVFLSDGEKGTPGESGDTIIPFAYATNVPYGTTNNLVTNQLNGLTNYFYFKIPEGKPGERGAPGVDLAFHGNFNTNETPYPENSLVRYGTNVWFTEVETTNTPGNDDWQIFLRDGRPAHIAIDTNVGKLGPDKKPYITTNSLPGNEQDIELHFYIPQGIKGDTGTIEVGDVTTGDAGTDVIITNSGSTTAAKFDFTIPRGYPGAGLSYVGQYEDGHSYLSNSLVRVNSDMWYAEADTSESPSSSSSDWSEFLTTTRFNIITNGEALNPDQPPQIISSYDETNNVITMSFKLPRGFKGDTKEPIPGIVSNVPTRIIEGIELLGEATVTCRTNLENPNQLLFDFGIPVGLTGADGEIGPAGTNATIIIGEVTNIPPTSSNTLGQATVNITTNEGNSYTFDFGIPAGIDGKQGVKGDNGATLVPKGLYNATNVYYTNELVRFNSGQYYVIDDNNGTGISGLAPTNGSTYWELFLEDGSGVAVNATTLFSFDSADTPIYHTGNILLDTNTLIVISTNITGYGEYDALTVVGGVGGSAVKQWEIDDFGGLMPAEEMYSGYWDYDEYGAIMPPLEEHASQEPTAIVQVPITASRIVETASAHVMLSDYIIWMDGDTAGENQTLYLDDLSTNGQTVIVRQLGDTYETTIVRGNNTYSLYGDGSSITFDWLPMKNNWYWRNY